MTITFMSAKQKKNFSFHQFISIIEMKCHTRICIQQAFSYSKNGPAYNKDDDDINNYYVSDFMNK